MDDLIRQAATMARAMWQHRWLGLAAAWLAGALGGGVVLFIPDKYEASARIFVDTQSILKPLMSDLAVQPNIEQQVVMLSRTLISRPNVEKLIAMADLDRGSKAGAGHDELIDNLMKRLEIKSTLRDNLYTIAYRDPDPARARRVVESLVSIFVESSQGDTRKDSESAKKFIDAQIRTYEQKLEEAENRLKEFRMRNVDLDMLDEKGVAGRLADISNQLGQARLELREAENAREALKRQIFGEGIAGRNPWDPTAGVAIPEIDGRIEHMKRNLDMLLQRYTEQHPDVIGARRIIKELEEQKREEVRQLRNAARSNPGLLANNSSISQELKQSLATAEATVASLRARVAEYESRHNRIKESMKSMPQIEAEFAQLNRDYEVHKKNYEALVLRRESATLSEELESAVGVADFRLIDPPRVSPRPVAPNRLLIMPLALLVALVAGVFSSFLASQLRPVFLDGRSLREFTDLPVLGSVSLVSSDSMRSQERTDLKRFLLGVGALFGVFAIGLAVLFVMSGNAV